MTSLSLADGSWDDARGLINRPLLEMAGADAVERSAIRKLLEVHEWDFPAGLDDDAARRLGLRDVVAPATSYLTFALPAYWSPNGPPLQQYVVPPLPYRSVPGVGSMMIATAVEVEFSARLHPGDTVTSVWRLLSVTPRRTRVGDGAFLTFEALFSNQHGEQVARETTTVLRYEPAAGAPSARSHSVPEHSGMRVRATSLDLTLQRLVMAAGANRDFAPVHHDPEVAAAAGLGRPFANSMFMATQFERTASEWAGEHWTVERMRMELRAPAAAGSTLVVGGVADADPRNGDATLWLVAHADGHAVATAEVSGSVRRTRPQAR